MANKKKIEPIKVATIQVQQVQEASYFEPNAGEYHLIALKNGAEIAGSDFSIGEAAYKKTFEPLIGTKFALKKNPKK